MITNNNNKKSITKYFPNRPVHSNEEIEIRQVQVPYRFPFRRFTDIQQLSPVQRSRHLSGEVR